MASHRRTTRTQLVAKPTDKPTGTAKPIDPAKPSDETKPTDKTVRFSDAPISQGSKLHIRCVDILEQIKIAAAETNSSELPTFGLFIEMNAPRLISDYVSTIIYATFFPEENKVISHETLSNGLEVAVRFLSEPVYEHAYIILYFGIEETYLACMKYLKKINHVVQFKDRFHVSEHNDVLEVQYEHTNDDHRTVTNVHYTRICYNEPTPRTLRIIYDPSLMNVPGVESLMNIHSGKLAAKMKKSRMVLFNTLTPQGRPCVPRK